MPDTDVELGLRAVGGDETADAVNRVGEAAEKANQRSTQAVETAAGAQKRAAEMAAGAVRQLESSLATYVSWAAVFKFLWDGVKGSMEDDAAFVRATGALRMTGLETGENVARLKDLGAELQAVAVIADSQVYPAFMRMLIVTRDMAQAEYLTELATKFAMATHQQEAQVIEPLTQALTGKEEVLKRLVRAEGMVITESTTLTQMFDFMEQKIRASGDSANTAEVKFKRIGNTLSDFGETIGGALVWAFQRLEFGIGTVINVLGALATSGLSVASSLLSGFTGFANFWRVLFKEGPVAAYQYSIDFMKQQNELLGNMFKETWKGFGDDQGRMMEQWGIRAGAALDIVRKRPDIRGGGGTGGEDALEEARKFAAERENIERDLNMRLREMSLSEWDFKRLEKQAEYSELLSMFEAGSEQWEIAYRLYTNEMAKIDRAEKDARLDSERKFNEWYKSIGGDTRSWELDQLQKQYDYYAKYVTDKAALDKWYATQYIEITSKSMSLQKSMLERFKREHAGTASFIQSTMGGAISTMTSLWAEHFDNQAKGVEKTESIWARSGKAILAMVLQEVQARLTAKATEFALLAAAYALALDWPHAAGYAAGALLLGGLAVGTGVAAAALTREPAIPEKTEPRETGGGGGSGRGGTSYGGTSYGGAAGSTITNSTVTLNYNPVLVVNGNVYGIGDLKELWTEWNREHSFLAGEGLSSRRG